MRVSQLAGKRRLASEPEVQPPKSRPSPLPSFGQYASYAWTGRPFIGVVMCMSRADRVEPTAAPKGVAGPLLGQNVKPPTTTPHATTVSTIQFRMAVSRLEVYWRVPADFTSWFKAMKGEPYLRAISLV